MTGYQRVRERQTRRSFVSLLATTFGAPGIRGKAVSLKVQSALQNASAALLISVMLFATYNDILRLTRQWMHLG